MASLEQGTQTLLDDIESSEKKETNVSVVPVPSPQVVPRDWPDQPEQLTASRLYDIGMSIYDIFLTTLTLALVAKTTLIIVTHQKNCRDRKEITYISKNMGSTLTKTLQNLNQQIVTAFTIAFIAF